MPLAFPNIDTANRRRFSSSDSTPDICGQRGSYGPYRHQLWLPDTDTSSERRMGLLVATAAFDYRGRIPDEPASAMDRYYYRTAFGLAGLAHKGFEPAINALGIHVDWGKIDVSYNKHYFIKVAFPETKTVVSLGNTALGTESSRLRFGCLPAGKFSTEAFIGMMSEGVFPLTEAYPTPDKEVSRVEFGSHDLIQHAAAVLAMAGTHALERVKSRALGLHEGTGYQHCTDEKSREKTRGNFMREFDSTANVMTANSMAEDDRSANGKYRLLLGPPWNDPIESYLDEIRANITNPLRPGFLNFAGAVEVPS